MTFSTQISNKRLKKPNFISVSFYPQIKKIDHFRVTHWHFAKPLKNEIGVWKITYKNQSKCKNI